MSRLVGEEGLKVVRNAFKFWQNKSQFMKCAEKVTITSAGDGHCQGEFTVDEDMTNPAGTLHGGFTAAVVDIISSIGLLTHKNQSPGVSVNLSVNYMKAAKPGENVIIDSKAVKVGKKLAYLEVQLRLKETNALIATASHVKYVGT